MLADRQDIARRATAAFEHAGDRLAERGVSDLELGRAMVASGLSRWSRAVSGAQIVEELAGLVGALAHLNEVDLMEAGTTEVAVRH